MQRRCFGLPVWTALFPAMQSGAIGQLIAMALKAEKTFELRGRFAGFFRNADGKRRMRVLRGDSEVHVKVPKELRRRLADALTLNCEITATGVEKRKGWFGKIKRVATRIEIITAPTGLGGGTVPPQRCPPACIRICSKKNCWKRGGEQLWRELEQRLDALGLAGAVKLKAVGCMDQCKRAPGVLCHGRPAPADTEAILQRVGGRSADG